MTHHDFKKGFLLGGIFGGAVIGLLGSRQGKAFRNILARESNELYNQLKQTIQDVSETSQEMYDELVDTLTEEYAAKKELALGAQDALAKELKTRWWELQGWYLFKQIKNRLKESAKNTKEEYDTIAEELVSTYAVKKAMAEKTKNRLLRELKTKWRDYKETLAETEE